MNALEKYATKQHLTARLAKEAGTIGRYLGAHADESKERSKLYASRLKRKGVGHAMWGSVRDAGAEIRDTFKGDLPAHRLSTKATNKAADWLRKRRESEEKKPNSKGSSSMIGRWAAAHHNVDAERSGLAADRLKRKGVGHALWGGARDAGAEVKGLFKGDIGGSGYSTKATNRYADFVASRRKNEADKHNAKNKK